MQRLSSILLTASVTSLLLVAACGDSGGDNPGTGGSGPGGSSGSGNAGSGGSSASGGSSGNAGSSGDGMGGASGTGSCDIHADLPKEEILKSELGEIQIDKLTSDKVWLLNGKVFVTDGKTLEIEPCTRIEGSPQPDWGALVIARGGRIKADGEPDRPILFTSQEEPGNRAVGDWGGVVLLGRGPRAGGGQNTVIEGFGTDPRATWGGTDPDDNSGSMSYVRIEYGGVLVTADNEINGLTMGGVGRGTTLHHIMVSNTADDCFEWFGGAVNADHLVSNNCGDDMFDADEGYQGNLQFLFGRIVDSAKINTGDPRGFELDGHRPAPGDSGRSSVNIANATLCGLPAGTTSIGAIFRTSVEGRALTNVVLSGFNVGFNVVDAFGSTAAPKVALTGATLLGIEKVAPNEPLAGDPPPATANDDLGFDEIAWFNSGAKNTKLDSAPAGFSCGSLGTAPTPFPPAMIEGAPPLAPLKTDATYSGAFKDESDNWMTGAWIDWAEE